MEHSGLTVNKQSTESPKESLVSAYFEFLFQFLKLIILMQDSWSHCVKMCLFQLTCLTQLQISLRESWMANR